MDWLQFTEAWRGSYLRLTRGLDRKEGAAKQPYKTVDQHHHDSLIALLAQYNLGDLWSVEEVEGMSQVWHKLAGWPDASAGLQALNDVGLATCTLSNGNIALLQDLARFANLPWAHIISSEHFQAYKPSREVYLGAVHRLGLKPGECAMVAAHLTDLWHAKEYGLKTVYVERELEEDWDASRVREAREDGWVDIWIGLHDGEEVGQCGFLELAKVLASAKAAAYT